MAYGIRIRLSQLIHNADKWYSLNEKTNLKNLSTEVKADIVQYAIPFFKNHRTVLSLIEIIDAQNIVMLGSDGIQRFLLYIKSGMSEKAGSYLNKVNAETVKGYDHDIKFFAEKYQIKLYSNPKIE